MFPTGPARSQHRICPLWVQLPILRFSKEMHSSCISQSMLPTDPTRSCPSVHVTCIRLHYRTAPIIILVSNNFELTPHPLQISQLPNSKSHFMDNHELCTTLLFCLYRSTMLRIHLTSWRTSHWRARPTSLRRG